MRLRNSTTRSRLAAWVAPRRLIVERLEERRGLLGRLGQGRPRAALTRLDVERLEDRCLLSTIDMGTRSIVAADPATGQVGIAVVSFPTGVPAVVPVGEPGVIVADQAFPSYADSQAIIADIKQGDDAPTALAKVVPTDPDAAIRQFAVAALSPTSPSGVTVGTFTGSSAPAEKCALTGPTYAVVGDLQTSSAVCSAMAAGFTSAQGSLSRRLLDALLAGTPVGQDKRGEFSAVVRVFSSTWALANFTPISADAHVDRSANWQGDLKFGLDAWLSILTPGDRADLVELTTAKAQAIQGVLQALGY
ncbi:MAG: DUF1028 domain-containing protein, partial [Planctomycetes bacterium]|nr:DUF1028 domain-containing protein [Planctomycetota bacterium]